MTGWKSKTLAHPLTDETNAVATPKESGEVTRSAPTRYGQCPLPKFLTIPDVAELFKVSTKTVRRWIEDDELVVHRFNRQLRISERDLSIFIRLRRGG